MGVVARTVVRVISLAFVVSASAVSRADAQTLTIQEWVDQFVATCVGSGSSDTASGLVAANGDISLKKLTLSGNVAGQVVIQHKDARLLTEGINNAMSNVAANEADQVRNCLSPVRQILVEIMQSQFASAPNFSNPIYILTPEEDVIVKSLANRKGYFGKTGEAVLASTIQSDSGLGDIRYRTALKRLSDRGYAFPSIRVEGGDTVSLAQSGDEYALRTGFAK
jgi:hypothetical protein